eukprot:SAG31_NODE_29053_length_401_cov_1.221854_1_plen_22_part_10
MGHSAVLGGAARRRGRRAVSHS